MYFYHHTMALLVESCKPGKVCEEQLYLLFSNLILVEARKKENLQIVPNSSQGLGFEERLGELVPGLDLQGQIQQSSAGVHGDRRGTAVCLHAPLSPTAAAVEEGNDLGSVEGAG